MTGTRLFKSGIFSEKFIKFGFLLRLLLFFLFFPLGYFPLFLFDVSTVYNYDVFIYLSVWTGLNFCQSIYDFKTVFYFSKYNVEAIKPWGATYVDVELAGIRIFLPKI
jgi:hypothetical protein